MFRQPSSNTLKCPNLWGLADHNVDIFCGKSNERSLSPLDLTSLEVF